ncbi:hypothetical protein [Chenggangzhangella methanolivorans]|uniref:Uncharacterized protein n=1 Tax=Chenggangzhangella methanolivorans TaxID=1437009 RepID=A0A9E6RAQ4_9HYPH|nr:hypothetical protein [Chenggangzhangella methanolivorans]QZO01313.1 hypothetical protein K6K41_07395 [Chenggangzhangella methanolivorans]
MTSAVLQALSGSPIAAFFARAYIEIEAFFEEAGAALVRAQKEEPFGL